MKSILDDLLKYRWSLRSNNLNLSQADLENIDLFIDSVCTCLINCSNCIYESLTITINRTPIESNKFPTSPHLIIRIKSLLHLPALDAAIHNPDKAEQTNEVKPPP